MVAADAHQVAYIMGCCGSQTVPLTTHKDIVARCARRGVVDLTVPGVRQDKLGEKELERILAECGSNAKLLFLPSHKAHLAVNAKRMCPTLILAHLGSVIDEGTYKTLKEEYAGSKEIDVPGEMTKPALQEVALLFPEATRVICHGSPGLPSLGLDASSIAALERSLAAFKDDCPNARLLLLEGAVSGDTGYVVNAIEKSYRQNEVLDLQCCSNLSHVGMTAMLAAFPRAQYLFLPLASNLSTKAKELRPALKLAHLGAIITHEELQSLRLQYKKAKRLVPRSAG